MPMLERVLKFLNHNQVEYLHTIHEPVFTASELASVEHLRPQGVAKVVVFWSERGCAMAVIPADMLLNLDQVRSALGLSDVSLATKADLGRLFPDSELGAMAPLGNLYGLPVFVDEKLAAENVIAFNAGTHRDVVKMHFRDFERLVKPRVVCLGRLRMAQEPKSPSLSLRLRTGL
jgi:Ala-tRNA(Pro) deacylase